MDMLLSLNYSIENTNIGSEIEKCLSRGADLTAGNHYAMRNAKLNNNVRALQTLIKSYQTNINAKNSYDYLRKKLQEENCSMVKQMVAFN